MNEQMIKQNIIIQMSGIIPFPFYSLGFDLLQLLHTFYYKHNLEASWHYVGWGT